MFSRAWKSPRYYGRNAAIRYLIRQSRESTATRSKYETRATPATSILLGLLNFRRTARDNLETRTLSDLRQFVSHPASYTLIVKVIGRPRPMPYHYRAYNGLHSRSKTAVKVPTLARIKDSKKFEQTDRKEI